MKIDKAGLRKDLKPFFTQHVLSIPTGDRQPSPFLVVDGDTIKKCNTTEELLEYPNKVEVLQTWPGKKRSDIFTFTIKDLKNHIKGGK
ncbi:MAG: hypothetical protein B7C24_15800 [Bacteroidetes bacterium 4572_77]|nr:MAG: hypothetical protein B7C24_15800 [Bacteroidetes bacterium 4572_77]